jgi:hypothetical protein
VSNGLVSPALDTEAQGQPLGPAELVGLLLLLLITAFRQRLSIPKLLYRVMKMKQKRWSRGSLQIYFNRPLE